MIRRVLFPKGSFSLLLTAYLTAASVAILTLDIAQPGKQRWIGSILLLTFLVLLRFLPTKKPPS